MAVFPDRIVLKNSADDSATITAAIQPGGTDEVLQGELVVGIQPTAVALYTRDGDGNIVVIGSSSTSAITIVSNTAPTLQASGEALVDGNLWFYPDEGTLYVYYQSVWEEVSGGGSGGGECTGVLDGGDADTGISQGVNCGSGGTGTGDALAYNRGDGGDFDAGTVAASFQMSVFGAGDVTSTAVDYPVEMLGAFDGGEA